MKIVDENSNETKQWSKTAKIVDDYGNEAGHWQGSEYIINDSSGNRLGWIDDANCVIDTYNNKLGEIRRDGIYNNYGSRVGNVEGDALASLLNNHSEQRSGDKSYNIFRNSYKFARKKSNSFIGVVLGTIWAICFSCWGGRIGVALSAIIGIITIINRNTDIVNGILVFGVGAFFAGLIGAAFEGIIRLIIKFVSWISNKN